MTSTHIPPPQPSPPGRGSKRRGSVVVIVLWSIAVAAIIVSSVQLFGHRQATLGREAVERVQARWAARAGMEDTLMVMTDHTERPVADDAFAMALDMHMVHAGETIDASYSVEHEVEGRTRGGPMDEHSKININRADDRSLILALDDMTLDIIDAINDWIDQDDEVSSLGVERDYYLNLKAPYLPRNGALRSLGELELIAGIWPKYFRNEDWNLNNRLEPNEDDGARSFPPDEADAFLDGAWSTKLTVYSVAGGATASGFPRIYLKQATPEELMDRLGVSEPQAQALINYGQTATNTLTDLLVTPLPGSTGSGGNANANNAGSRLTPNRNSGGGEDESGEEEEGGRQPSNTGGQAGFPPLNEKQIRAVLAETCIEDPLDRLPGKMNINTIPAQLLRDIFDLLAMDEAIADEIIYMRSSRPQGIVSLDELKKIPNVTNEDITALSRRFDVVSNVFTISSRGRSAGSGQEIEIVAVVDRSTVPVRILEYREQ